MKWLSHQMVYLCNCVHIDGKWYGGVGNIGDNPTFKNQYHRCEVHVFDFNQDVYGKAVLVQFISYLRGEFKFDNLDNFNRSNETR